MPLRQAALCPHDRRPGMVCLHCRHAERELARARRRTVAARVGVLGGLLALLAGGAAAGADALQGRAAAAGHETAAEKRASAAPSIAPRASEAHALPAPLATTAGTVGHSAEPAPGQATAAVAEPVVVQMGTPVAERVPVVPSTLAPAVPDGRTELGDSLFAVRTGDTVRVYFDTQETRTRRRDKFERIVRTTLPRVFGAAADSALAIVPAGTLADGGDLLSQLPARGVRVALSAGRILVLWPETRPGRDGPLVVSYRAVAGR